MVALAVINILLTMATLSYGSRLARARQVEAMQNIKALGAAMYAYQGETGQWAVDATLPLLYVTSADRSTATSCNVPNPYGFHVNDCRKVRYIYYAYWDPVTGKVTAEADELLGSDGHRLVFSSCDFPLIDHWHYNLPESTIDHVQDPMPHCQ